MVINLLDKLETDSIVTVSGFHHTSVEPIFIAWFIFNMLSTLLGCLMGYKLDKIQPPVKQNRIGREMPSILQ